MLRLILVLSIVLMIVVGTAIGLDVARINELRASDPAKLRVIDKFKAWNCVYRGRDCS